MILCKSKSVKTGNIVGRNNLIGKDKLNWLIC